MANLDLVSNDHAMFIANGLDLGAQEISIVQFGKRLLQRRVKVALQGEPRWRSENARVDPVGQPAAILGNQLNLPRRDGHPAGGFVIEPCPRREQHKDENQDDGKVVLPGAALVGPEKRP